MGMSEITGPVGFQHIDTAPKDGTLVRLRFRPGLGREDREEIGLWVESEAMIGRGHWLSDEGYYITPGPLFWAPYKREGYTFYTGYRP